MSAAPPQNSSAASSSNFLRQIIAEDLRTGKYGGRVVTRFPPEPNGYLHIGHAKSICLNFGLAGENGGACHLRFDDTNPVKEDVEYEDSIKSAVQWLGFDWGAHLYHASDYFDRLYEFARHLIKAGLAYVDSSTPEEMRHLRGNRERWEAAQCQSNVREKRYRREECAGKDKKSAQRSTQRK